jgi:hypothetical protein
MLEIHPIMALSKSQCQYILECWKRRPSFIKSTRAHAPFHDCHAMTNHFFWSCIPRTLHDLIFEHVKRHRPCSASVRFFFHIHEIHPGANEDMHWTLNKRCHYMIPLTFDTVKHGHTTFKNHPDLSHMPPGRLLFVQGKEKFKNLSNNALTSRIFMSVYVST